MNILLLLFIITVTVTAFVLTLKNTRYNTNVHGRNKAEDNLENLYKIQNYEFWRDFGKRGEQKKTK